MHSAFFGTPKKSLENVKEAPWTMLVPMGVLSVVSIILGIVPGLALDVIAKAMDLMGLKAPTFTMFSVKTPLGAWQGGVVIVLILLGLLLGFVLYLLGNRKVRYTDTYTCGVSDLTDEQIQVASQNLYESPEILVSKVHSAVVVPMFGDGEEVQK